MLLEIMDISVSHPCACTCCAIAIFYACFGSVLQVRVFGGFYSLNATR